MINFISQKVGIVVLKLSFCTVTMYCLTIYPLLYTCCFFVDARCQTRNLIERSIFAVWKKNDIKDVSLKKTLLFLCPLCVHMLIHKHVKCAQLRARVILKGSVCNSVSDARNSSLHRTSVGRCVEIYYSALFASLVALLDTGSLFSCTRQT